MLRKLAAVVLLVGLCTPYSCDVRPISVLYPTPSPDPWGLFSLGVPVLAALWYALATLVPALARRFKRGGDTFPRALCVLATVLIGFYVVSQATDSTGRFSDWLALGVAALWSVTLALWALRRASAAARIPLLLLAIVGLPVLFLFHPPSALQYGGWILTAGYLLAVLAEVRDLARPTNG
ncbi:MAG: hypothetical protein A2Y95_11900 [Deltaproteobacteria bacterium RBG_13_65_10]|nr:MAG: hypothetical protein A2Y95_11900 [Deltaproteobacteria bacterium RBG_13_65_10]